MGGSSGTGAFPGLISAWRCLRREPKQQATYQTGPVFEQKRQEVLKIISSPYSAIHMFIHIGAFAAAFLMKKLNQKVQQVQEVQMLDSLRSRGVIIPPAPEDPNKTFCTVIKDDVCCARYPEGVISCNPVAPRAQDTPNTETVMVTVTRTRTTTAAAPTVTVELEDDKEDVLEEMAKKLQDAYMLYRQTRKRGGKDGN